ncbi:MAG: hypothetical protein AB8G99_08620 [Planctomycetaceae bacterium]
MARLRKDFRNDRVAEGSYAAGDITIKYQSPRDSDEQKSVVFEHGEHVSGDFTDLQRLCTLIEKPLTDFELGKRLEKLEDGWILAMLNFGLRQIFGLEVGVSPGGMLLEFFSKRPDDERQHGGGSGVPKFTKERWPSGFHQTASMLLQILTARTVALVDEPERSLEPIRCRHLVRFLLWLTLFNEDENKLLPYEKAIVADYSVRWAEWIEERRALYKMEDEANDFRGISTKQLFVASHAPQLIQEFLACGDSAAIFDFNLDWYDNSFNPNSHGGGNRIWTEAEKSAGRAVQATLFTSVRRVESGLARILDNIGASGSDILQANGVVWVEGPSDIIFLTRWIEMFSREKPGCTPRQGIDFQFQMFGGALLDSLCLTYADLSEQDQLKKLIDMFSFSRNAYVIIDSDALLRNDTIVDNSNFQEAKRLINQQFVSLNAQGFKVGLWYDEGNTARYSIESYLDEDTLREVGERKSESKVRYAQKIVDSWGPEKKLSDFKSDLKPRINDLVGCIRSWQSGTT